ncbi:MAG TPA: AsmA-like C-terminal region-containing protein [Bacteroidales bacterium]|nr:AsmA-like C-terminal region-containing protein [Bacteroidales bacterium]
MVIISASLITASYLLSDQVAEIVLNTINKNIATKIDVGSFRLSLLKKFPRATLELKDVYVLSSEAFNNKEFEGINTDTLLIASNLSVDFNITDIINKIYDIERVGIRDGRIYIYADSLGRTNYVDVNGTRDPDSSRFALNLRRIFLSDLQIIYNNHATRLLIDGTINDGKLTSKISNHYITLGAETELFISRIQQDNITISIPFNAGLDLEMEDSENGLLIKNGDLSVEGIIFHIAGNITSDNVMNLELDGENIDLSKIRKYLPEIYNKHLADYALSGNLKILSSLTGEASGKSNPHIESTCILENGSIAYAGRGISISNISFNGSYSNGIKNNQESAVISIRNLKAHLGSSDYSGNLSIRNLNKPLSKLDFRGRIFPGELKHIFNLQEIEEASGFFDLDMKLTTDYWPDDSISINDLVKLKPEASMRFSSFNIKLRRSDKTLSNVNGEIILSSAIKAKNLSFLYQGQKISVNGEFNNLPEWLAGHNVRLKADANIHFDKLITGAFYNNSDATDKQNPGKLKAFSMPQNIYLDIILSADALNDETITASDVFANLVYKPGLLTFNSFKMKTLDGTISGNGFAMQNNNKSLICKGIFTISDVNINRTFTTFRNFGQNFIKAENLSGNLTGSLTLLLPLDSLLKPQIRSVVAEGRYIIYNGALINFEPVRKLSSFIDLKELENIRFEKLENDFFIRNNSLFIPQMDVNSSAADMEINGRHNFNNTYEYHVKIKLSELLSQKRKKNRTGNTEFGVIEDDGLGRTSLLLRIESKGNDIKVGYDVKAAGEKVKTSIKSERQTMKNILNQEYGFFKADTITHQNPAERKPRVRITWDDSDTLNKEPESSDLKKEKALRSLFKKK